MNLIQKVSFKKKHLKMSSTKYRSFYSGFNVLRLLIVLFIFWYLFVVCSLSNLYLNHSLCCLLESQELNYKNLKNTDIFFPLGLNVVKILLPVMSGHIWRGAIISKNIFKCALFFKQLFWLYSMSVTHSLLTTYVSMLVWCVVYREKKNTYWWLSLRLR